jgi:superfamily II DNA or RNA helicase
MTDEPRVLRERQLAAIEMLRGSLRSGHRRPVMQAPTGFGKTIVATAIFEGALAKGKRAVLTVPALELIDQTVERLAEQGIRDVGVIQADHRMTDWSKPIQVCSVQTLVRRNKPEADLVVVDECHRAYRDIYKWMGDPAWAKIPFVGMSATPWTVGLGKHFDDLLIAARTRELINEGLLCPFRTFAPSHPDLAGIKTVAGDYNVDQLADRMNQNKLVGDVVGNWCAQADGRPTFVFAVDRAHARAIEKQFHEAGVRAAYMDAYTNEFDRAKIKAQFKHGEIQVVCNVGVLTIGIDWPNVSCISLVRPTKSEILYCQMIGRGLRTCEGKQDLLILDHSDTTLRLGFVDEIHHDKLSDGKPNGKATEKQIRLPRECPRCHALRQAAAFECPHCGYRRELQVGEYVNARGELVEIGAEYRSRQAVRNAWGAHAGTLVDRMADAPAQVKREWLGMLLHVARQRGYASGWVSHTYRDIFGVWPTRNMDLVAPREPTVEVWKVVEAKKQAYKRSKQQ